MNLTSVIISNSMPIVLLTIVKHLFVVAFIQSSASFIIYWHFVIIDLLNAYFCWLDKLPKYDDTIFAYNHEHVMIYDNIVGGLFRSYP